MRRIPHQHGGAAKLRRQLLRKLPRRRRPRCAAEEADILLGKTPFDGPAHPLRKLRVVAQLRVRIERQVVGEEADVVRKQRFQARLADAIDAAILAAPEPAVMHQDGVRPGRDGGADQVLAGRHAADNTVHLGATFHLQAVWAIIAETSDFEDLVEMAFQFRSLHGAPLPTTETSKRIQLCTACGWFSPRPSPSVWPFCSRYRR
jgi:hypothetical protein